MGWESPTKSKGQKCDLVLVTNEWNTPWRRVDKEQGGGEKENTHIYTYMYT